MSRGLYQVGDVHGHLFYVGAVVGLEVLQRANVVLRHEVDRHAFPTETTASSDSARLKGQ